MSYDHVRQYYGLLTGPEMKSARLTSFARTVLRNRVVVTQPRRIAAISIAERVAWERCQTLGQQ
eukprot:4300436-Amphidinium_carterae.1